MFSIRNPKGLTRENAIQILPVLVQIQNRTNSDSDQFVEPLYTSRPFVLLFYLFFLSAPRHPIRTISLFSLVGLQQVILKAYLYK
ncbi:hypothetical protein C477_15160 [Haloterrigena salina JCM 13891]|uniref:Uncharacterized protein n=1 Tax=Haloterrigena salina JCM 13891 TaxID=1227488 RepID=M0C0C7_9EURY|nr:hypothetical protein C477_15160 [Haloterrigena salina JCM 13891]